MIAEEAVAAGRVPATGDAFFLVDPLDGTRAFIKGSPEFTINIGLIVDRKPVFGIIYAPALDQFYATLGPHESVEAQISVDAKGIASGRLRADAPGNARARSAGARRFRQPLARIADHRRIPAAPADRGEAQGELVAEVLSDRARRSRPLCASRADERMGHRCRPSDSRGRRRQRDDARRAAARSTARRTPATPTHISSPGRASRCCASPESMRVPQ